MSDTVFTLSDKFIDGLGFSCSKQELCDRLNINHDSDSYKYNVHMSNQTLIDAVEKYTGYRVTKISGLLEINK